MREKFGGGKCEVEVEGKKTRLVNRVRGKNEVKVFYIVRYFKVYFRNCG